MRLSWIATQHRCVAVQNHTRFQRLYYYEVTRLVAFRDTPLVAWQDSSLLRHTCAQRLAQNLNRGSGLRCSR